MIRARKKFPLSGYFPAMSDDELMEREKIHLDHYIDCSKKINSLLVNWLWNTLVVGGIAVAITGIVALILAFGRYICLF